MDELKNLLYHFNDLIKVKVATQKKDILYKGIVLHCIEEISETIKGMEITIHGVATWDMFLDCLVIMVDVID